jgi:hypothetical protein
VLLSLWLCFFTHWLLMLPCCTRFNSPLSPSCVRSSNSMVKERMTSTLLYAADSNLKVEGLAMGSCRFDNRGNLNKLIHQVKITYITCGCLSWFDCSQYCLTDVGPCRSFLGRLPHPDVPYAHVQLFLLHTLSSTSICIVGLTSFLSGNHVFWKNGVRRNRPKTRCSTSDTCRFVTGSTAKEACTTRI